MRRQFSPIFFFSILLCLLIGCTTEGSQSGKPTQPAKPEAGKATVIGRIIDRNSNQPMKNVKVWLAEVVREGDQGAYVWDTTNGPAAPTNDQGYFSLQNINAMEYVVIVGEPHSRFEVIPDQAKLPKVWNVLEQEILDVGDLVVDITSPQ